MNPSQVIDLTQNKKLQSKLGNNKIKGLVVYDSSKKHQINLIPSQMPKLVLISDKSVVRSVEVWATVDDNNNSETSWSGKFSLNYNVPKFDPREEELSNTLMAKIVRSMDYFSGKSTKTLNIVLVGGLGDGKSELCSGIAQSLGSTDISFQAGSDFERQEGYQNSITKSSEARKIQVGAGQICIWNVPGLYETLDNRIVEKEPALNYVETLLAGNIEPETIFTGNTAVPSEFNPESRIQVVIFTITAAQLKTESSFLNLKPTYSKYINYCNKYGVKYMFVLTKFDNLSDNYLKYDGATLKWTGSKYESCPHNGYLYATLSESPEYLELESRLAAHYKTSVIFPMINNCDDNKKFFDSNNVMEVIRKNTTLQMLSYAVDLGTKASYWQKRP